MTDKELMQQALEALEMWCKGPHDSATRRGKNTRSSVAIAALRERLAQPEQEPVAWVTGWHDGHCVIRAANPSAILPIGIALYTTPPRRDWVGLTEEEIAAVGREEWVGWPSYDGEFTHIFRLLEAKLREKNA